MEIGKAKATPEAILKVGFGFQASKILLAAVQFQLFTFISKNKRMTMKQVKTAIGLKCTDRHAYDFLDSLVALNFLEREGLRQTAFYSNSPDVDLFLDSGKPSYIGGIIKMANNRFYPFWGSLEEGLRNGSPLNEEKIGGDLFATLYENPQGLTAFVNAMGDFQAEAFLSFSRSFDFAPYKTLLDVGGSGAVLSIAVAKTNPHIRCTTLDLAQVQPIARANIEKQGLSAQIEVMTSDFFKSPLPKTDIVVMGNILHDWDLQEKKHLIKSAYSSLNEGGVLVVIQNMIDDERRHNLAGMLMSLHMLLETKGGFNFTLSEFTEWTLAAGFKSTKLMEFSCGQHAALAFK